MPKIGDIVWTDEYGGQEYCIDAIYDGLFWAELDDRSFSMENLKPDPNNPNRWILFY